MNIEFNNKEFLKRLKEVAGKTQREIAQDINSDNSTVSRWGKESRPTVDNLLAIASCYNCSIDYLLGLSDSNKKESKDLDLWDILKLLLIYDMQDRETFGVDSLSFNGNVTDITSVYDMPTEYSYNAIIELSSTYTHINDLMKEYVSMKENAFQYVDNIIKLHMIDGLIEKYSKKDFINNLPFKSE